MPGKEYQVNSLLHCYIMGENSDDVLSTLTVDENQRKKYTDMCNCEHFIGKHNVIYERATFNSRYQQPNKSMGNLFTDVHKLVEHC